MNCFIPLMCEIFVIAISFHSTLGFDIFDGGHQPTILHSPRIESAAYIPIVEEQPPASELISYLLPERRMLALSKSLIPYPRTGRMNDDEEEYALIPDYHWCSVESDFFENGPKISNRLGRKKRSISSSEESDDIGKDEHQELAAHIMDEFDDFEPSYYYRQSRRPSSRSRNSFVPRVGKRLFEQDFDEVEDKRAKAFTPRIGRASLIPRIGRNDPRFKVKSRGAFIPRIGRRASFTPRIGRSQDHHDKNENA